MGTRKEALASPQGLAIFRSEPPQPSQSWYFVWLSRQGPPSPIWSSRVRYRGSTWRDSIEAILALSYCEMVYAFVRVTRDMAGKFHAMNLMSSLKEQSRIRDEWEKRPSLGCKGHMHIALLRFLSFLSFFLSGHQRRPIERPSSTRMVSLDNVGLLTRHHLP